MHHWRKEASSDAKVYSNSVNPLLLIDTCNVLHADPALRRLMNCDGLDVATQHLLEQVRVLHDREGFELHLVVDGEGPGLRQSPVPGSTRLSVIHTPHGMTADALIESWLMRLKEGWNITVASEDRIIQNTATSHGADVLTAEQLLSWVDRVSSRLQRSIRQTNSQTTFSNSLESYFK